jgi:hypothetical protein
MMEVATLLYHIGISIRMSIDSLAIYPAQDADQLALGRMLELYSNLGSGSRSGGIVWL